MKFIIESSKSKTDIINALKENTHEEIPLSKCIADDNVFKKFFRGTISDDSFTIQHCVRGQTGFVPLIYGTISENLEGSKININLRRIKSINIFFGFWFAFIIFLFIAFCIVNTMFCFFPLGMIIFGFLLNYIPYRIESKKAINKLNEIFKTGFSFQ